MIYEKVNDLYVNQNSLFEGAIKEMFQLLLIIIDNKNDNELEIFYNNNMSNIKLKEYYFTRLFNPYRECCFNSFDNFNDFIDKTLNVFTNNINFYLELNIILKNIIQIHENIKNKEYQELRSQILNLLKEEMI